MRLCPECHFELERSFKYCPKCGIKIDDDKVLRHYSESFNEMSMIYGPMYSVTHHCLKCHKEYLESGLGQPELKYCPYCGEEYKGED